MADDRAVRSVVETNIVVPRCAMEALAGYCDDKGVRRDPTVRALIDQYLDAQGQRQPAKRLTHISTVIWHPNMPVGRHKTDPYAVRLRMRLPAGAGEQARRFALRLPGQTDDVGGYHDYRPRLLADALLTALAAVVPFTDDVLDELPPTLTHRQAIGLFRLGVAASATRAEERIYLRADGDLDQLHSTHEGTLTTDAGTDHAIAIATLLREEDIAWHGQWRRAVTRHLAREWLTGEETADNLAMLDKQDAIGFGSLRRLLEQDPGYRDGVLKELRPTHHDYQGRGGTAIWRAERRVGNEQMLSWLADTSAPIREGNRRTFTMSEPGWNLALPDGWHAVTLRHGDDEHLQPHLAHARERQVLHACSGGTHIFWPYQPAIGSEETLKPIPAVATVLASAEDRDDQRLIEYLLAPAACAEDYIGPVEMNAFVAHDLGFIDRDQRDSLVVRARQETQQRMDTFLDAVPEIHAGLRLQMQGAMECPAAFSQIVSSAPYQRAVRGSSEQHFYETRTRVAWPREQTSLAGEIAGGLRRDRLQWLTGYVFRRFDHALEMSMNRAWERALHGYRSTTLAEIEGL